MNPFLSAGCSLFMLANTAAWLNLSGLLNLRNWLACYLSGSITMMTFWCFLYLLWVPIFQQPYPLPLIGVYNAAAGIGVIIAVIWFKFPVSWRQNSSFRYKAKFIVLAQFFLLVLCVEYWFFSWVFYVIPLDLQWILSIVLPIAREIGAYTFTKILEKVAGCKDSSGEVLANHLGLFIS